MEIHVPCVKSEPMMPCTTFRFSKHLHPILKLNSYHILLLRIYVLVTLPVPSVLVLCLVLKFRMYLSTDLMEIFFFNNNSFAFMICKYILCVCVCVNVEHSKHGNLYLYLQQIPSACLCNTFSHSFSDIECKLTKILFFFKQQRKSLIKKHQLVFKGFFLKIFLKAIQPTLKKKKKGIRIFLCLYNFGRIIKSIKYYLKVICVPLGHIVKNNDAIVSKELFFVQCTVGTTKQLFSECKPFLFTVNRLLQQCIDYFYNFYFLESDFQSELEEKYLYELNQLFSCHLISYNQGSGNI